MFEINPVVAAMYGAREGERFRRNQETSQAAEWKAYAEQLQDKLVMTECKLAGALALVGAYKKLHPNSPLLQPSNVRYTRGPNAGQVKNQGTLLWEQAFDAAGKRLGLANPAARRDSN